MSTEIKSSMDRTGSKKAPKNGKTPAFVRDAEELKRKEPIKVLLIEPL